MNITADLRDNSILAYNKMVCSRFYAFLLTMQINKLKKELKTAKKLKVLVELLDAYCQRIFR